MWGTSQPFVSLHSFCEDCDWQLQGRVQGYPCELRIVRGRNSWAKIWEVVDVQISNECVPSGPRLVATGEREWLRVKAESIWQSRLAQETLSLNLTVHFIVVELTAAQSLLWGQRSQRTGRVACRVSVNSVWGVYLLFVCLLVCWEGLSLWSPDWPGTCSVREVGLELTEIFCLCLQSTEKKSMSHLARIRVFFLKISVSSP